MMRMAELDSSTYSCFWFTRQGRVTYANKNVTNKNCNSTPQQNKPLLLRHLFVTCSIYNNKSHFHSKVRKSCVGATYQKAEK